MYGLIYFCKYRLPSILDDIKSILMGKKRYLVYEGDIVAEFLEYSETAVRRFYKDYSKVDDIEIVQVGRFDSSAIKGSPHKLFEHRKT